MRSREHCYLNKWLNNRNIKYSLQEIHLIAMMMMDQTMFPEETDITCRISNSLLIRLQLIPINKI